MPTQITEWSEALMTSLAAAMMLFFSAIPKVLAFLVIVIAGWFVATLVEKALASMLRTIRFNDLAARAGLADFVRKTGMNTDPSGMLGLVVKWFIRLVALVVAFDALGLPAVSDVLRELLLWLPNVLVALVVLVVGGLAARALGNLVRGAASEAGFGNAQFLAKFAHVVVWAFTIVVAVNQLGIATELVNTLFMAVVGALALGAGLAFGLGGRETAGEIVRKWYARTQERSGKVRELAGDVAEPDPDSPGPGHWPMGGYPGPAAGGAGGGGSPVPADRRHDAEGG